MNINNQEKLNYKKAGVDIELGNELTKHIKNTTMKIQHSEIIGGIGGFGALYELPINYKKPILVAGADGVGTKLHLAIQTGIHHTVGIDLVAMCVNDLIVQGAKPLFFLDYYASSKLNINIATTIIDSIVAGCEESGCALIGGETAEMPGMYQNEDYDLAGFCVGIVEKDNIINGSKIKDGDVIIGLTSSGVHSNGYSLIRKIIEKSKINYNCNFQKGKTLGETLLIPTRIYVKPLLKLMKIITIKAISHITGGGLLENIPRIMPNFTKATINTQLWELPKIFKWIKKEGNITTKEMYRTFNCGIGMIICISKHDVNKTIVYLRNIGEKVYRIGNIEKQNTKTPSINII